MGWEKRTTDDLVSPSKSTMSDTRWAEQFKKVEYSLTQDKALQNPILKQFNSHININW